VSALFTTQLKELSSTQIQAIETRDLIVLSTAQVAAIGTAAVAGLTTSQLAVLDSAQMAAFTVGQQAQFSNDQLSAILISPLVLDLNGDGIQTLSVTQGVNFDLNNDGKLDRAGWVAGGDALLVRDLNGDGRINDGGELFGEGTVLSDGRKAKDGYEALSPLDSNLDGVIDANDAAWSSLKLWVDNGNGVNDQGELKSLSDLGITALSLNAQTSAEVNNGNLIGLMGSYMTADGQTHTMGDVWFSVDASGNRTFDLAAAVQQSGSSKVNLGNASADTLKVSLADVLSFGEAEIGGIHQVTITGDAGDTVQLANAGAGWTASGTVSDGVDTYMVYVNANAQLLVNDKIHIIIV